MQFTTPTNWASWRCSSAPQPPTTCAAWHGTWTAAGLRSKPKRYQFNSYQRLPIKRQRPLSSKRPLCIAQRAFLILEAVWRSTVRRCRPPGPSACGVARIHRHRGLGTRYGFAGKQRVHGGHHKMVSKVPSDMPPTITQPICERVSAPAPVARARVPRPAPWRPWSSGWAQALG